MQGIANPRSNLAQSHYSNFFTIKKRVWETLSMTWFLRVGATGFEPAT